jgi:2'-5' RNA ligase
MKKRLFVAILLQDEIKEELITLQKKFKKLNIRWANSENLHFTIAFLGWIEDSKLEIIKEILKRATQELMPFILKLEKIILGPDEKRPRMIWASGTYIQDLNKLREIITEQFKKNKISFEDRYPLKFHITLARARGKELFGRKIEEDLDLVFPVDSIYLMESELKSSGAEYKKIANFKFKKS